MDCSSNEILSNHSENSNLTSRLNVLNCDDCKDASVAVSSQIEELQSPCHIVQNINRLSKVCSNVLTLFTSMFHWTFHLFGSIKCFFTQKSFSYFKSQICDQDGSASNSAVRFEDQVKSMKDVLSVLKTHAVKAEEEYVSVVKYFENIKDQSKIQEDAVDKTMNEINVMNDRISELNFRLTEKSAEMTDLQTVLAQREENLSNAESKLKCVAKQLHSVVSPGLDLNFEEQNLEENYTFVVDNIEDLKNKMQSQNNLIRKMSRIIHSLDELNKVNKNINQQNEKMNHLKVGLREKSDILVGDLKNIAGRLSSESVSLHREAKEDFHGLNESLSKIVENTELFLESLNVEYNHLEEQNQNADEFFEDTFSDLWQETSVVTVVRSNGAKDNAATNQDVQSSVKQVDQTRFVDFGCQTSPTEETDDADLKTQMKSLQEESNALKAKYECAKKRLRDCKLERSQVIEVFEKVVSDLKMQVKGLSTKDAESSVKIAALKTELDNLRSLEKENVDLKACIISKDKELDIEKRKIEEVTEFEKEKYKKVVHKLQQCLKSMKKGREEAIQNSENISKVLVITKTRLDAEKKSNHHLRKRYETMTKNLLLQIESEKKTITDMESENRKLVIMIDCLNKKILSLKLECESSVQENEAAIVAFKQKDSQVEHLKEENKKIKSTLQENRVNYKSALRENYVNYCYNSYKIYSQSKDNQSDQARVLSQRYTVETSPHITYRPKR